MRSKLFVPGSRPDLFSKAMASQADAVSIDLEDSVLPERKDDARSYVSASVQACANQNTDKVLIVRVNAQDTEHFEADVLAVVRPGLHMINLPKIQSAADILAAVAAIEQAERCNGVTDPVNILANIETPKALRCAVEIATAHRRVVGLQLGLADLFEPFGITRHDPQHVHAMMFAMRMAAAEGGVFAFDAAYGNVADSEGFRAEAAMANNLGYLGKSCIHPSQIAVANAVFRPSDADIAHARRVVDAAESATAQGYGALLVDGKLVDAPFLRRAQAILSIAETLGNPKHA
jgi:citrate lyase subunit beta/citryl-CoA lyase